MYPIDFNNSQKKRSAKIRCIRKICVPILFSPNIITQSAFHKLNILLVFTSLHTQLFIMNKRSTMKFFFSAGETSGDILAAGLIAELKKRNKKYQFVGFGSLNMKKAGMKLLMDFSETSVVGVVEALKHIPRALYIYNKTKRILKKEKPDILVVVDCQGFNLPLAKMARKMGIRVVYFIPPQNFVWNDVKKGANIVKRVDKIINIYRLGYEFYKKLGADCDFVGHPVIDLNGKKHIKAALKKKYKIKILKKCIGLIPGTRAHELERIFPVMIESAELLSRNDDSLHFLIPAAGNAHMKKLKEYLKSVSFSHTIIADDIDSITTLSDFVITKSGTSVLNVAMAGVPYVVVYKISTLSFFIFAKIMGVAKKIKYVSWPNLMADKMVARELLQGAVNSPNIVKEARRFLYKKKDKEAFKKRLLGFKKLLGKPGVFKRAGDSIEKFILK